MLAYKVFDKDLKCKNMQYEIGKEYEMDEDHIYFCHQGFHSCKKAWDFAPLVGKKEEKSFEGHSAPYFFQPDIHGKIVGHE